MRRSAPPIANPVIAPANSPGGALAVHLTIRIPDIDFFRRDPKHEGAAEGSVQCPALGGELPVESGTFQCLADAAGNSRVIRYNLFFTSQDGRPFTLQGEAGIQHGKTAQALEDVRTVNVKLFAGHVDGDAGDTAPAAAGIVRMGAIAFAQQLTSFHADAPTLVERKRAIADFATFYLGELWETYGPKVGGIRSDDSERLIPIFTLEGVHNAEISTHYFSTADHLGLSLFRFQRAPCDDVVVLLHGLTNSTDMFIMPEHYNLVNYLLDHGFTDVWSLDWRGSMRFNYDLFPTNFSMDDTALYDMPAAFAKIRAVVGPERRIHVISHCLGSVSFMMSLYAGLVDGITSIVSNSVSITPHVPRWSYIKLCVAPFLMNWILRFTCLNPRWASLPGPGVPQGKLLAKFISLGHPECNVPACHMLSFMWGSGRPGVYRHENLEDITHRRTGDLFGAININYYLHVRKMARLQLVVKMRPNDPRYAPLPGNYLDHAAEIDTPILFVTGDRNRVFTDSNVIAYNTLARINPDHRNELRMLPGYGHQDPIMGKNSHADVFPIFVDFIERSRRQRARGAPA